MDRQDLVKGYFGIGLRQNEILSVLANSHNIIISKRQLQRDLSALGLYRRRMYSDVADVSSFITEQLATSANRFGYRLMHLRCIQVGFVIQKETVRLLLSLLDPNGVDGRLRRRLHRRQYSSDGPNYIWHIDGYDKLKPYGLCVNACIDGFSRHLIWFEVNMTNNDPAVIASYYLNAVKSLGGIPKRCRTDMGTENCYVADMQTVMGGMFLYGTSQHNQRIESWWGILRRCNVQFWLNLFKTLKDDNQFSGSFLDKSLVQFCFTALVKEDFVSFKILWESHSIQRRSSSIIPGRPMLLYHTPEAYGFNDCLMPVDPTVIDACLEFAAPLNDLPCDETVYEVLQLYMEELHLSMPADAYEGVTLYRLLRDTLLLDLSI